MLKFAMVPAPGKRPETLTFGRWWAWKSGSNSAPEDPASESLRQSYYVRSSALGAFDAFDVAALVDEDDVGFSEEQAVIDDAGDVVELAAEGFEVFVAGELDVEDEVAVVGDEELAVDAAAADAVESEASDGFADAGEAERHDSDRKRRVFTDLLGDFSGFDHVDALPAGPCDHAFAGHGAATSLHDTHVAIDFVGTVDEEVEFLDHGELDEFEPLLTRKDFGGVTCRDAPDIEVFGLCSLGQSADAACSGASCAEPDEHSTGNRRNRGLRERVGNVLFTQSGSPAPKQTSLQS